MKTTMVFDDRSDTRINSSYTFGGAGSEATSMNAYRTKERTYFADRNTLIYDDETGHLRVGHGSSREMESVSGIKSIRDISKLPAKGKIDTLYFCLDNGYAYVWNNDTGSYVPIMNDILDKLSLKADRTYVDAKLSTKADATHVNNILNTKADKVYVDAQDSQVLADGKNYTDNKVSVKADKSYVDTIVAAKADKTYVNAKLNTKVDKLYVDNAMGLKADKTYVDNELNAKADKTYVDGKLDTKADKADVNYTLSLKADKSYIDNKIDKKADKSEVDIKLSSKADKTYVDGGLSAKADKTHVDSELSKKADKTYVDSKADTAKTYTDNMLKEAKKYADNKMTIVPEVTGAAASIGQVLRVGENGTITANDMLKTVRAAGTPDDITKLAKQPINTAEIFSNWQRISCNPDGSAQNGSTSEQIKTRDSYYYDNATESVVNTYNSAAFGAFVSLDKYSPDYRIKYRLKGRDGDDDGLFFICGFMTDSAGKFHTISVVRTGDAETSAADPITDPSVSSHGGRYAICYDVYDAWIKNGVKKSGGIILENTVAPLKTAWNANTCICEVSKTSDKIVAKTADVNSNDLKYVLTFTMPTAKPSDWTQEQYDNIKYMMQNPSNIGFGTQSNPCSFTILEQEGAITAVSILDVTNGKKITYLNGVKQSEEKDTEIMTPGCFLYSAINKKLFYVKDKTSVPIITGDSGAASAPQSAITGVKGDAETSYRTGNVNITKANIGLSNVNNTADSEKSVKYAENAGKVNNLTVEKAVPADAKFTDTTYSNFVKSGSGAKAGLVPAPPTVAGTAKYLREDGTWQTPPGATYTAASAAPKANGTAAVGTSAKYAREDHVHPLQTSVSGSSGSCTGNAATASKIQNKTIVYIDSFDKTNGILKLLTL